MLADSTLTGVPSHTPRMEWHRGEFTISDDPAWLDLRAVCTLLGETYWAKDRAPETVARSVRHSLCFGIYENGTLVGFARVVTDRATVGYLCDVVVSESCRGAGLGRWLLGCILEHPDLHGCRIDLFTRDAEAFYRPFGFGPHRFTSMVRYPPDYDGGPRN
jgi:GNAT superfamily N-acetyltransferase